MDQVTAGGSKTLYYIGRRPAKPQPKTTYMDAQPGTAWQRSWLPAAVKVGVFLTDKPTTVGINHAIRGHVYAYRVPYWVIKAAGGIHRTDDAREVLIPEDLWPHVEFLGKSMDAARFNQKIEDILGFTQGYERAIELGDELRIKREKQASGKVIVVDVQPAYKRWIRDPWSFMEFLNGASQILCLYNGPDLGMDTKDDILEWWIENGFDYDKQRDVTWDEKGYGFFRDWMDGGMDYDTIGEVVVYMMKHRIWDSRDIDLEDLAKELGPEIAEEVEDAENYGVIGVPDIDMSTLKRFRGATLVGGACDQCLAEVKILLHALNISYRENRRYIYGAAMLAKKVAHRYAQVAKELSDEEKAEIYKEWRSLINMSQGALDAWAKDPDRLEASLSREEAKGIQSGYDSFHRIKRRKGKPKAEWTAEDYKNAKQEIGFNSRMLGNDPGKPVGSTGRSKWEISLRNWGHDPSLASSPAKAKYDAWKKKHKDKIRASKAKKTASMAEVFDLLNRAYGDHPAFTTVREADKMVIYPASSLMANPQTFKRSVQAVLVGMRKMPGFQALNEYNVDIKQPAGDRIELVPRKGRQTPIYDARPDQPPEGFDVAYVYQPADKPYALLVSAILMGGRTTKIIYQTKGKTRELSSPGSKILRPATADDLRRAKPSAYR